jgi:NAD(P)-dependent dehydrogenase (short-subunit alcohol dehydrogenase family)
MSESISFEKRVAVVTGGGRGIGRAHCLELAVRGASVVVNDLPGDGDGDGDVADEVVREIRAGGGRAVASHETVVTPEGAQAIIETALNAFGSVDVLINNAGVMKNGYFETITPEKLELVVSVSLLGSYYVSQAAWPVMRGQGYGRVIMTSSAGGLFAQQGISNYAAAKGGVYGLSKALSFEGAEHGITVNVVLPMAGHMYAMDPVPDRDKYYPSGLRDKLEPIRHVDASTPIVVYLASEACTLTGEAYAAGFGRFARVFVGETQGWVAPEGAATAEDVAANLDEIRDLEGYVVPRHLNDEVELIASRLGLSLPS